jgi:hypothetical protein
VVKEVSEKSPSKTVFQIAGKMVLEHAVTAFERVD